MPLKPYHIIIGITTLLLLIPLIAMQFTNEVNWSATDFLVAGILLLSTGFSILLVAGKIKKPAYRISLIIAIVLVLLLV